MDEKGSNFMKLISEAFELCQASNPQDFLPVLRLIDYGGFTKRMVTLAQELDSFFQCMIDEQKDEKRNSMIGHLLSLQESEPELYSDLTIKGLILVNFLNSTMSMLSYNLQSLETIHK